MSAPAPTQMKELKKIYNLNNILDNEYFGQIDKWKGNVMDRVGNKYAIEHPDTKELLIVEFVGCFAKQNDEIEKEMDWPRFSGFCPLTTIRELCGFVDDNWQKWKKYSGFSLKIPVAIYVFKNLNYKTCQQTANLDR